MEKVKRKSNPQKANRRFALVLVGFIVFSMSISLLLFALGYFFDFPIPLIIIQQPFTNLTPILYLIISLVWIPFAIKHNRIYGLSKWHWVLIIACILSVALMTLFLYLDFSSNADGGGWCFLDSEPIPYTPFSIYRGWSCYWFLGEF